MHMPPLDENSPDPLHRQLAAALRAAISSGELTGRLPTEERLRYEYGAAPGRPLSRDTVRRGLLVLKDEGLIDSTRGRGWFVVSKPQGSLFNR